jgi:uncharacterized protein with NAD-binding domain and iron-sulfur cluster
VSHSVAVLGGGVGGLSAAHELAERGFAVSVYESRTRFGGKSRSIPVPGSASQGRADLPAEHGFRFFPGFYRHLPDTMSRIPGRGRERVSDDLVAAEMVMIARDEGRNEIVAPAHAPATIDDFAAVTRFLLAWFGELGIDPGEQAFFLDRLLVLLTSCDERRFGQWERQTWWGFVQAERHSAAFQRFLADGLTRTLVAAQAREISARTGGFILLQLLFDLSRAGGRADRLLDAPTNDVWIDPWVDHLRAAGVELHGDAGVVGIDCRAGRIAGVTVERDGSRAVITADHYVAAMPVEQLVKLVGPALVAAEPRLRRLHLLRTRWMNGIVFYLRDDVPVVAGHTIYIDSDWALTSISQRQFWPRVDFARLGHGNVGGVLSVDVSDWERPSRRTGKVASMCSAEEIKDEVWAQLKDHLNGDAPGETLLDDANLVGWYLDDDISFPNPTAAANAEPLLINTAGSWANRPDAVTSVPNLFLAADFVRTHTDLATMEGANEAARRAVNGILDAASSTAARCAVWPLREPALFGPARALDRIRWSLLRLPAKAPLRVTASGGLEPVGVTGRLVARAGRLARRRPRRPR